MGDVWYLNYLRKKMRQERYELEVAGKVERTWNYGELIIWDRKKLGMIRKWLHGIK